MMFDSIFGDLFTESERQKENSGKYQKKRFLYEELKKERKLMVGIYGLRGVGKTTLLLQIARETGDSIYVNCEELVFRGVSIIEFAEFADKKGFTNIFLDEIHSVADWANELKLLYDRGIKRIFFTGSSSLKLQEQGADLSRRAILLYLPPLSFREFLDFLSVISMEKTDLGSIMDFGKRKELLSRLAPHARYFDDYMKLGSFPFYFDQKDDSYGVYKRVIGKIVRNDMLSVAKMDTNYVDNVYKILDVLAISNPNEMNYNSLSNMVKRSNYVVEEIIRCLREIGVINSVLPAASGASMLRKEHKLLLAPPFRYVLAKSLGYGAESITGGLREDIFVSNTLHLSPRFVKTDRERKTPDYVINGTSFELGPHKFKHDTDFYVKDELVIDENVVPLFLFGFLY